MTATIRRLRRDELDAIWSVDRGEVIDGFYRVVDGELVLDAAREDVPGWPPGEREKYGPLLLDCFECGGAFWGAFAGDALVGVSVLESRFIGRDEDRLQLKFFYVDRSQRGKGLGRALFDRAADRARALGARSVYVSSIPARNTVDFYLAMGCRLARELDPELYALEPDDVHLELALPAEGRPEA